MATFVEQLADFAAGLRDEAVPDTVRLRVRLQLLHMAASIDGAAAEGPWLAVKKMAPRRGAAPLKGGGTTSPAMAARVHASMAASVDRLDHLLGGYAGVGSIAAALALAKGRTVADVITAAVVGNEIGGRVGAALLLGPHHGGSAGWVPRVAAAATAGRLLGLDREALADALAVALVDGGAIPRAVLAGEGRAHALGVCVSDGVEAARAASGGLRGQRDILEAPGGLIESSSWVPLPHAFSGLGTAWLTSTLSFPRWPGPPAFHAALDGIQEILDRHIKAADKRLRGDQVSGIKVTLTAPALALESWSSRRGLITHTGLAHSLKHAIGALIVDHELGASQLSGERWAERREQYGDIARLVKVEHDIDLTMELISSALSTASPLFSGLTEREFRELASRAELRQIGWPDMRLAHVRSIAAHRPDRWLRMVRYASHDLAQARLDDWQLKLGAGVEVSTTRGGKWPDRRVTAVGGPSTPLQDIIGRVSTSFANGNAERLAHARMLFEASPVQPMMPHVERLLA